MAWFATRVLLALSCWSVGSSTEPSNIEDAVSRFESQVKDAELAQEYGAAGRRVCQDEPVCKKLGATLQLPGETECRYPAAELCPRMCGRCPQVLAATRCQFTRHACPSLFKSPTVDWGKFFEGMLERAQGLLHVDGARMLSSDTLWLAELPEFLSADEADRLVAIAETLNYERENDLPKHIRDVHKIDCEAESCLLDPLVSEVYRRTSMLLGLPMGNFESLEFLKYGKGQHYVKHTDPHAVPFLEQDPEIFRSGPRIMTVFFYFTDVDDGGETGFPNVGLKVKPAKGKAVVWANVESDWWNTTMWSQHQSLPVKRGKKVAANFWVHPFEFRIPGRYAYHCYPAYDD